MKTKFCRLLTNHDGRSLGLKMQGQLSTFFRQFISRSHIDDFATDLFKKAVVMYLNAPNKFIVIGFESTESHHPYIANWCCIFISYQIIRAFIQS